MKKTSNAEYADDRLIDLRQLDHLQFDDVHEAYYLDWSNMLLLMRWIHDGEDSTIVIDRRGRLLNVERRYSELISELAKEYHVYRNTMATLYKKTAAKSILEMVQKNYEGERCCEKHPDFNHLDNLHQLENRVRYEVLGNALDGVAYKLYGHPMDEEFKRLLKKRLIAPYDGTNH